MAQLFNRNACNNTIVLSIKPQLQPMWDEQQKNWIEMMEKLPIRKMPHSDGSDYHGNPVASFLTSREGQRKPEWNGIKKCWMPLPNAALMFPAFRYVP